MSVLRKSLMACGLMAATSLNCQLAQADDDVQSLERVEISAPREYDAAGGDFGGGGGGPTSCKGNVDVFSASACGEPLEQLALTWPWEKKPCSEAKINTIDAKNLKKDGQAIEAVQQLMGFVTPDPKTGKPTFNASERSSYLNATQTIIREAIREGISLTQVAANGSTVTYNLEITEGNTTVYASVKYDKATSTLSTRADDHKLQPVSKPDSKETNEAKENALNCSTSTSKTA